MATSTESASIRTKIASWTPGVLFLVFMVLVSAPNIYLFFHPGYGEFSRDAQAVFSASLVLLLLTALVGRLGLACWLLLPVAVFMPIELLYMLAYGVPSSPHILALVAETNFSEAADYLGGKMLLMLLAVLLNAGVCVAIARYLSRRQTTLGASVRWRLGLVMAACLAFTLSSVGDRVRILLLPVLYDAGVELQPGKMTLLRDTYPFGIPFRVHEYFDEAAQLKVNVAKLEAYRFHAHQDVVPAQRQVYVLVIGETGRRDRWALSGYGRPTNPRLAREANLVYFSDMLSIAPATRMAVPSLLTRKPARDVASFSFSEPSVIKAFKQAGFATYFLSNQMPMGFFDNLIAVYANEADHVGYYNLGTYDRSSAYDGALVPILKAVLARPEQRQFIVLHTLGSHFNYSRRYPRSFDVYQPSLWGMSGVSLFDASLKEQFSNSYDNSILYTDAFLDDLVGALRAVNAQSNLVYVADHGEDLFDGTCTASGHGNPDRKDFEIPGFAWYSDEYAAANPERVAALRANGRRRLNAENIFYSLLDGAGIRYDGERPDMSFFSATLRDHDRLVLSGVASPPILVDFDKARFDGACARVMPGPGAAGERLRRSGG